MMIDSNAAKKYLKNTSKAILDARNALYTEEEMQSGIDALYNELQPEFKGKFFLVNSYWDESAKRMTAQCYIEGIIKPAIKQLNKKLNWDLKIKGDIMKQN